ncbi:MAG: outer membrane beta-barrel protein [Bacteroidales bacterium]|nr:outer membrane beta-barrel protein [Bacteroidales bacterium]
MIKRTILLLLLVFAARVAGAQVFEPVDNPWYAGAGLGTSLGQCTFRSITEHEAHWGFQGGVFGGYRFNRLLSVEAGLQFGGQSQYALDCCTYWLSEDGTRYMSPVLDETGWYYHDVATRTGWGKFALQGNADLLSLITAPDCRWSLNVGPQLGVVSTKTKLVTPDKEIQYDRQWHLGLGGQASVGYQITENIGASLYGGITCLSGERFDNMPRHAHKSNLIYDAGVKVAFRFGGKSGRPEIIDIPITPSADDEAARLQAERERLAAERAAREQAAREEAARRQAEREAIAAAKKEAAFNTPIPTVYFAKNSAMFEFKYQRRLVEALLFMRKYPDFKMEIHAYSSGIGERERTEDLSRIRMKSVRDWFLQRGISEDRLVNSYYHGVDSNAPDEASARRVELKFVK